VVLALICYPSHVYYMHTPAHDPWCDHPNNSWRRFKTIKLVTVVINMYIIVYYTKPVANNGNFIKARIYICFYLRYLCLFNDADSS
jgi:hypothetical protein